MYRNNGIGVCRRAWVGLSVMVVLAAMQLVATAAEVTFVSTWTGTQCGTGSDVWGEGDYAFWGHFFTGFGCVDILDVSDPFNPVWVSSYQTSGPDEFASTQDVKVHNGLAFVAYEGDGNNGCGIVDVRDPFNPVQLTTVRVVVGPYDYRDVHNLFYHQGYLYLADSRTNTLAIVDLTQYDPDNPPAHISDAKWHLTNVGTQFVHDVTVLNNRMYVAAWSDIIVYDITNIDTQAPVFLGSAPGQSCHACWATDDGRYIVTSEERSNGGIKLYGVEEAGDAVTITLLDEVNEPPSTFSAHNPIIVGDRVYTSWYESGLLVHQIDRQAEQLVEIGRYTTASTWGVYPFLGLDRILLGGFSHFTIVDGTLCDTTGGDFDLDEDVDFADFAALQVCMGATVLGGDGVNPCETAFDIDCDGDLDLDDYAAYLENVTGPQ